MCIRDSYYALADICMKTDDRVGAVDNLKNSLACNSANKSQRAESYLQLANLYYENEVFVPAKNYFDSTLQVLPKLDERYDRVARYAANLTDIAKNINIINLQDSLLSIAQMSPKDQRDLALVIKEKMDADAKAAKEKAKSGKEDAGRRRTPGSISKAALDRNRPGGRNAGEPSTWWAYNCLLYTSPSPRDRG